MKAPLSSSTRSAAGVSDPFAAPAIILAAQRVRYRAEGILEGSGHEDIAIQAKEILRENRLALRTRSLSR